MLEAKYLHTSGYTSLIVLFHIGMIIQYVKIVWMIFLNKIIYDTVIK